MKQLCAPVLVIPIQKTNNPTSNIKLLLNISIRAITYFFSIALIQVHFVRKVCLRVGITQVCHHHRQAMKWEITAIKVPKKIASMVNDIRIVLYLFLENNFKMQMLPF